MLWEPCETIRLWFFVRSWSPNQIPWRQVVPMIQNGDYLVVWVPATKYSLAHVHFQNSGFMVRSGASGTWWNINCFCGGPLCKAKQPWSARPFGRFSACWWLFFRYDGMSANATGMIWRTLLVALARVGKSNFNIFHLWRKHQHFARCREAKM